MKENEILELVKNDPWMMDVLNAARSINLPDWMIGAGFIRNKVWDHLHGFSNSVVPTNDIDLIYFDQEKIDETFEKNCETKLKEQMDLDWSVKNMARMHIKNHEDPYESAEDGLAHWVETATSVAVKLSETGDPILIAPHGIEDLVNLVLKPTPFMEGKMDQFHIRVEKKGWLSKWPKLKVVVE